MLFFLKGFERSRNVDNMMAVHEHISPHTWRDAKLHPLASRHGRKFENTAVQACQGEENQSVLRFD